MPWADQNHMFWKFPECGNVQATRIELWLEILLYKMQTTVVTETYGNYIEMELRTNMQYYTV